MIESGTGSPLNLASIYIMRKLNPSTPHPNLSAAPWNKLPIDNPVLPAQAEIRSKSRQPAQTAWRNRVMAHRKATEPFSRWSDIQTPQFIEPNSVMLCSHDQPQEQG
jgi:hypothetical protein